MASTARARVIPVTVAQSTTCQELGSSFLVSIVRPSAAAAERTALICEAVSTLGVVMSHPAVLIVCWA